MFAFMSGTARGSGGLLHCNIRYMPMVSRVVKAILLQRSKFFVTELSPCGNSLNIRKITLIRHSCLQGLTQFGL
jgi:hypothetical protein